MSNFNLFAKLAMIFNAYGPSAMSGHIAKPSISKKQLKRLRPSRYKSAFSMGFRGTPKTYVRRGAMPAPTIDQVRDRERKYGQRIHVKQGLMFFAKDGIMWTADEARRRQAA
jgi:hypothetical protein